MSTQANMYLAFESIIVSTIRISQGNIELLTGHDILAIRTLRMLCSSLNPSYIGDIRQSESEYESSRRGHLPVTSTYTYMAFEFIAGAN